MKRIQYSKNFNGCLFFVIVDLSPEGRAEFWAQEEGEVRWYPFSPTPAERSAAIALFDGATESHGSRWPPLRYAEAC